MQNLLERHSTELYLRALRFVRTRFRAYPPTQAEAGRFLQLRQDLQAVHEALLDAEEEESAQRALLRYLDAVLGKAVIALSLALLSELKNDRSHPLYQKAFPEAPSKMLSSFASAEQTKAIRRLLELLASEPELASFASHQTALQAAQADIDKELPTLTELEAAAQKAKETFEACKAKTRDTYETTYLRLKADKTLAPPLLESCFPTLAKASTKK